MQNSSDLFASLWELESLKQVLEYEDVIRRAIPHAPAELAAAGAAILHGRPSEGTRKDALREMAARLRPYLPVLTGVIPPPPC